MVYVDCERFLCQKLSIRVHFDTILLWYVKYIHKFTFVHYDFQKNYWFSLLTKFRGVAYISNNSTWVTKQHMENPTKGRVSNVLRIINYWSTQFYLPISKEVSACKVVILFCQDFSNAKFAKPKPDKNMIMSSSDWKEMFGYSCQICKYSL